MATARMETGSQIGFSFKEIPNAILGVFGIRTESELPFETLLEDGEFSVRNYPQHSELRTEAVGSRNEAVNKSFSRLFAYICGDNWEGEKFAMTTPVIQRPKGQSRWSTSFFMKGQIEDLPIPKTSAVRLYSMNSQTAVVIQFSGRPSESNVAKQTALLREWIIAHDLVVTGEPEVAQFDPPFAIPFLRRNEIHIPIEPL